MMNKTITPGSYLFDTSAVTQIKLSSGGLIGDDLGTFIKRAGYKMADEVRRIKFASGEVPVHLIAIGATEYYGPNRNGDAFDAEVCRHFHPTFVKHARWYRNHQNKDTAKSYGHIKHSAYNEAMHRIELIVALNGTKEAAKRNGGLVADEELEKLARGDDIPVSMACKVPFDICSGCGNKARTRAEYCKGTDQGGHCKEGGCSTRLGQVNENGHHLHVKNTIPDFFDLSKVWRGADHIAFTLGEIEKAAAAGGVVVGGAELSELIGLTTPFALFLETIPERKISSQLKLAYELAKVESAIMQKDGGFNKIAGAFMPAVQPTFLLGILDAPETRVQGLKALALEKIALPLTDFLRMYFNGNATKAAEMTPLVAPYLRGIYTYMTDHPEQLATDVRAGKYVPDVRRPTKEAAAWARAQAVDFSLDPRLVERRAWRATLRDAQPQNRYAELSTKSACDKGELYNLAKEYALYKLAMLDDIRESDTNFVLTCDLAIRQNHIS
jgi:hypothetical protein